LLESGQGLTLVLALRSSVRRYAGSPVRLSARYRGRRGTHARGTERPSAEKKLHLSETPASPEIQTSSARTRRLRHSPRRIVIYLSTRCLRYVCDLVVRAGTGAGGRRPSESAQSERLRLRLVFSFFPGWLRASGVPNVYSVSVVVYVLREGPLRRICSGCGFENRSREGPARRENERRDSRARRVYTPRIHIHTYPSTHDSRLTTDASSTTSTDDCHRLQGPYAWSPRVHCCQAGAVWSPRGVCSL